MRNFIFGLVLATVVGSLSIGAAASLALNSADIAVGSTAVTSCDPNGVQIELVYSMTEPALLDRFEVSDIDDACDGQSMELAIGVISVAPIWTTEIMIPIDPASTEVAVAVDAAGIGPEFVGEVWIGITGQVWFS